MAKYKATKANLVNGIQYVCDMLGKVKTMIDEDKSPYYSLPYYIYRGVTRFYPTEGQDTTHQFTEPDN